MTRHTSKAISFGCWVSVIKSALSFDASSSIWSHKACPVFPRQSLSGKKYVRAKNIVDPPSSLEYSPLSRQARTIWDSIETPAKETLFEGARVCSTFVSVISAFSSWFQNIRGETTRHCPSGLLRQGTDRTARVSEILRSRRRVARRSRWLSAAESAEAVLCTSTRSTRKVCSTPHRARTTGSSRTWKLSCAAHMSRRWCCAS